MSGPPSAEIVVDAHHHVLDPDRLEYHFLAHLPQLRRRIGPDELAPLLAEAGVTHTVVVQAHDSTDETELMLSWCDGVDWVAGVVGWLPLVDPARTADLAAEHRRRGTRLCGVRHLLQDEPDDDWLVRPEVLESLAVLAEHDLTFDVSAFGVRHLRHVPTVAETVPDLRLVVCHFGMPRPGKEWADWVATIDAAAECPQVRVKASGLDLMLGGRFDLEAVAPYYDHALEIFGADRVLWASNWPVSLYGAGYAELLTGARTLFAAATEAERRAIFAGTAIATYRLAI